MLCVRRGQGGETPPRVLVIAAPGTSGRKTEKCDHAALSSEPRRLPPPRTPPRGFQREEDWFSLELLRAPGSQPLLIALIDQRGRNRPKIACGRVREASRIPRES